MHSAAYDVGLPYSHEVSITDAGLTSRVGSEVRGYRDDSETIQNPLTLWRALRLLLEK